MSEATARLEAPAGLSPGRRALRRLAKNRAAMLGVATLLGILGLCFVLPPLLGLDPASVAPSRQLQPPSLSHLFGTDSLGRDYLARVLVGGQTSLLVGLVATLASVSVGVAVGAIAGYFGGRLDEVLMRLVDFLYGIPYMFLVILVMLMFSETARGEPLPVFVALGLVQWLTMARVVRGQVLALRRREFVLAAQLLGASDARVIARHILPNIAGVICVYATLTVPAVIILESFLSFLGLGVKLSWGQLVADAVGVINPIRSFWWLLAWPSIFLGSTLLGLNHIGDGLRDALDPKTRAARGGASRADAGSGSGAHTPARAAAPEAQVESDGPPLLRVLGLRCEFRTDDGVVRAVEDVSFEIGRGRIVGVVGESGCGKSATALAILGLLPRPAGRIAAGSIQLDGRELVGLSERELSRVRGGRVAMIFQDPMSSLNPYMTVGEQVAEVAELHLGLGRQQARRRAVELLDRVRIPDAERRAAEYPHQLSGGMRQRAMIAMALSCEPALVIADEPTTALDVTVQAQILELLVELRRDRGLSILLISHDLGVIASTADEVLVMYAGRIVEQAPTRALLREPHHPYTRALLRSVPRADRRPREPLAALPGLPPRLDRGPVRACTFAPRCDRARERCLEAEPALEATQPGRRRRCVLSPTELE